jgi:AcrR family transcriptional regulator
VPSFGKSGRPREDAVARRQQIFLAVSPLIDEVGVGRISMRAAARAAHLSVGGLYHYFGAKQDLLLYGLAPENLQRLCDDFRAHHARIGTDPSDLLDASVAELSSAALAYVRPSLHAAGQLGMGVLRQQLDDALSTEVVGLVETVRLAHPAISASAAADLDRALRRLCAVSLLDPLIDARELRESLSAMIEAAARAAAAAVSGTAALTAPAARRADGRSGTAALTAPAARRG